MFTTRPELTGTFGMVASTHWLASSVGMRILEAGGNAFDAAVAAGFTLSVVEPHLNGPGGDAPIIGSPRGRRAHVRRLRAGHRRRRPRRSTPTATSGWTSCRAPGTWPPSCPGRSAPGSTCSRGTARCPLADVLAPAIGYARDGYPLVRGREPHDRDRRRDVRRALADVRRGLPAARRGARGRRPVHATPTLADTFERLLAEARRPGRTARRRSRRPGARSTRASSPRPSTRSSGTPCMDSSGRAHAGLLRGDDLAGWRATEEPTVVAARSPAATVHKTGRVGSGAGAAAAAARCSRRSDVAADACARDDTRRAGAHAWSRWPSSRSPTARPGTATPRRRPARRPCSPPEYAAERARLVGADAADGLRPGSPDGRAPRLPRAWRGRRGRRGRRRPAPAGSASRPCPPTGSTPAATPATSTSSTAGATASRRPRRAAGCSPARSSPGLGFALPTRAQMFWLEPGLPQLAGPGPATADDAEPGASCSTTTGSGLAFGTPGGDQQDQWTVPFLLRHLLGGAGLQAAIDAPTWHSTHVPGSFYPRTQHARAAWSPSRAWAPTVLDALAERGHAVRGRRAVGARAAQRGRGARRRAAGRRRPTRAGMQGYAVGR